MMNTKQFYPIGYLRTQGQQYFLINPNPDREGDVGKSFLVVPNNIDVGAEVFNMGTTEKPVWKHIYPCPRIVVATDFSYEFDVTIKPILCKKAEVLDEFLFDDMVNKQGALK